MSARQNSPLLCHNHLIILRLSTSDNHYIYFRGFKVLIVRIQEDNASQMDLQTRYLFSDI